MKIKLYEEYISEIRNSIGDKFKDTFTLDAFTRALKDNLDIKNQDMIIECISEMLGIEIKDAKSLFKEWQYANYKLKDFTKNINSFYNFLMHLNPRRKTEKSFIGSGVDGAVFELNDRVVKLFYTERSNEMTNFYKRLKNNFKTLPKIFRANNNYIVMEKLNVASEKSNEFSKLPSFNTENEVIEYANTCKYGDEMLQWYNTFNKESEESGLSYLGIDYRKGRKLNYDISETNFGERENGDIVFFDPIYLGVFAMRDYEKEKEDEECIEENYHFTIKHSDIKTSFINSTIEEKFKEFINNTLEEYKEEIFDFSKIDFKESLKNTSWKKGTHIYNNESIELDVRAYNVDWESAYNNGEDENIYDNAVESVISNLSGFGGIDKNDITFTGRSGGWLNVRIADLDKLQIMNANEIRDDLLEYIIGYIQRMSKEDFKEMFVEKVVNNEYEYVNDITTVIYDNFCTGDLNISFNEEFIDALNNIDYDKKKFIKYLETNY